MSIYNPYYFMYSKLLKVGYVSPASVSLDKMMQIINDIKQVYNEDIYEQVVHQYQKEINQWQYEQYRVGGPKYNEAKKEIETNS